MSTAENQGSLIMAVTIKIPTRNGNGKSITEYIQTDEFGLFIAKEWKRLIDPYTPRDTGLMQDNAIIEPNAITYHEPYSHYVYIGISASGRPLNYQRNNPFSTDHWDEKAVEAGQLEKLETVALNRLI